ALDRVKSTEQLSEELAIFAAGPVAGDPQKTLADFKHREFLRIYLRDCLGVATLSEVTEELSNLADLIIRRALSIAETEQKRILGNPLSRDEKGHVVQAEIAVIALGKLGCRELNYSSDIDLFFIYSGHGETSAAPSSLSRSSKGVVTNKEFFTGVAERVVDLVGGRGEGGRPVYRVDLRLRPYGRDGDLVWPVDSAAAYYSGPAKTWERQALIRARASAGSADVAADFVLGVENAVFQAELVAEAIDDIDRMRQRIQQKKPPGEGFNVKLGRGGIRDIEFITQALQLKFGKREPWIRPAQMLIVLGRLSDKGYISKSDRSTLSAAYVFLRTVEHRVQMDQGAQTHSIPTGPEQLKVLANRCGYSSHPYPPNAFIEDLKSHTAAVGEIYEKVFSGQSRKPQDQQVDREASGESSRLVRRVSENLAKIISRNPSASTSQAADSGSLYRVIETALNGSINPARSLRNLGLWVDALATASEPRDWSVVFPEGRFDRANLLKGDAAFRALITGLALTLPCHYLANILLPRPRLAFGFADDDVKAAIVSAERFESLFDREIDGLPALAEKTEALRRAWYPQLLGIGHRDLSLTLSRTDIGQSAADQMLDLRQNNLEQTALAEATLQKAACLALLALGCDAASAQELPIALLGLGRLGHTGMDYGSDLDLLIVYDDESSWPALSGYAEPAEFTADFTTELVRILSSITREGTLYRVDLRLRPEGSGGPIACGVSALESYVTQRASAWEHSAYLKLREVAGNLDLGRRARERAMSASFRAACRNVELKYDLKQIRARLQKEKAKNSARDIKWGPGGMTDVYFITRYLQLRDGSYFPPAEGTLRLIEHLSGIGALAPAQAESLHEGYLFLRRLDQWIRLLSDRPSSTLPSSMVVLDDIARVLHFEDADGVISAQAACAERIRGTFNEVFS
ncbi:MAG: hypothetical protein ACREDR_08465, partial [Blastocatellia bacterium]